jgi:HAD superfamily hydrolase (TIGR01509 family)
LPAWCGLALVLLLAVSCKADVTVEVDVEADGSGVVMVNAVIDQETAEGLLDLGRDAAGIYLEDLADAGWQTVPPTELADGSVRIEAQKAFGTTSQFAEVMGELTGDGGVFNDFSLTRAQSFGRLDYEVSGAIDTTQGFSAFSDPDLEVALTRSLPAIAERYGASEQNVSIELLVTLPGELQEDRSNGANQATETAVTSRWQTSLASHERTDIALATTRRSITAQVLRGVAVLAVVVAALLLFGRLLRLIGSRRRPTKPARRRSADALGRHPDEGGDNAAIVLGRGPESTVDAVVAESTRRYRVVALDGMGVLYREGNDIAELLVPFARQRGSEVPSEDIAAKARLMSLGRMTPAVFWPSIGVEGNAIELDAAYLSMHQLSPGVVKYLRKLRADGVRAACVTNDGAEWATKLRASHSLEGLIDPWVVSGSVGVRKPDAPIFEVLRRVTGEAPHTILIVDDDLDTLDAARGFGFGTAWFKVDGDRADARGHELWRSFELDDDDLIIETVAAVTGEVHTAEPPS